MALLKREKAAHFDFHCEHVFRVSFGVPSPWVMNSAIEFPDWSFSDEDCAFFAILAASLAGNDEARAISPDAVVPAENGAKATPVTSKHVPWGGSAPQTLYDSFTG